MKTPDFAAKPIELDRRDALVVVDVQRDFCPGGALEEAAGRQALAEMQSAGAILEQD